MKDRGFSLVELVVVIGIMAILLSLATFEFRGWQRKMAVERQVQELYSDIQAARMNAAFTKVIQEAEIAPQQVTFRRFSSSADAAGTVVSTKTVTATMSTNFSAGPQFNKISFNTSGVMSDPLIKVICFANPDDASYDALIITPVLTSMGKQINKGAACARTNVTKK